MINRYFFVLAATAQFFSPITEIIISIGMSSKEAKAEIEIHPAFGEAKIRKCSI